MKNKSLFIAVCSAIVILLAGCGEQSAGTPAGAGSSSTEISAPAEDIGLETAKAAAIKHAGVSASEAEFTKAKLDYDDGVAEYDIEFTANSMKYEYEIKAADGSVLEFSAETTSYGSTQTSQSAQTPQGGPTSQDTQTASQSTQSSQATTNSSISESEAKQIVLNHAGFSEAQVTFTQCKLDYDNGVAEYDIEFTANAKHYEYEIRASDGKVLEFSSEAIPDPTGLISESRAKEIALTRAGFSASQVSFKKCELDYDNGITKYEVEFTVNGTEYEFEINANTGAILEMDVDHDDDHHDDHH